MAIVWEEIKGNGERKDSIFFDDQSPFAVGRESKALRGDFRLGPQHSNQPILVCKSLCGVHSTLPPHQACIRKEESLELILQCGKLWQQRFLFVLFKT